MHPTNEREPIDDRLRFGAEIREAIRICFSDNFIEPSGTGTVDDDAVESNGDDEDDGDGKGNEPIPKMRQYEVNHCLELPYSFQLDPTSNRKVIAYKMSKPISASSV